MVRRYRRGRAAHRGKLQQADRRTRDRRSRGRHVGDGREGQGRGRAADHDVITLAGVGAAGLAEAGLLAKPDLNRLPNLKDVAPQYRTGANGFGIGYLLWSDGLIYNTATVKSAPSSYEALWDPKYAGRLFLPPPEWAEAVDLAIIAAKLAGGSQQNIDPGFRKLAQLKDRVMTLGENPNQVADLFTARSTSAASIRPRSSRTRSASPTTRWALRTG